MKKYLKTKIKNLLKSVYNNNLMKYISGMKEFITREPQDEDAWVCKCGNTPHEDGFYPCDKNGHEMEPEGDWDDLFWCARCDRIIQQDTLEVVGKKSQKKSKKKSPAG